MRLAMPLLLLGLAVPLPAQVTDAGLTLTQAVEVAFSAHPSLRAAESERRIAQASLQEAGASRWPITGVTETITRGNNPVFVFGSLLEQSRFGPANFSLDALNSPQSITNFRTQVDLRFPVFDRRQTETRIDQAKVGVQQSDLYRQAMEQQVRFNVIRAYFGLAVALARKNLADSSVQMADEDLKRAASMHEAGMTVESDLLAARVQRSEFRQQQIQAEAAVVSAIAALNVAMGQPISTPRTVAATMKDPFFELVPQDELITRALANRPDYLRAAAEVRSAQYGVTAARADALPRVDIFANYGLSGRNPVSGSGDYAAGATVTINLFDAGRKARVEKARAMQDSATAGVEQLADQIRLEVVQAHQNHISSDERLAVARLTVTQSEEAHRIVQDRYQAGLTTITEVLRAETALVRARTNLVDAQYDQRIAYASVLFATGTLTNERPFAEGGSN
jgi:outer membrane protein TolC